MNPTELLDAYAKAVTLLQELRMDRKRQHDSAAVIERITESWTRVRQALYALARFREIELMPDHRPTPPAGEISSDARTVLLCDMGAPELEFYAESFYQFAFRGMKVLREVPVFEQFDAPGVRGVRHRLIQHAEQPKGAMSRNYTYDDERGFVIKPFGGEQGRFEDRGLYPNAEEFVVALLAKLETVQRASK